MPQDFPSRAIRSVLWLGVLVAAIRVAGVVHSARTTRGGDFVATLPGAYAETLNPRLWNSDDLRDSMAFHRRVYVYGPAQYLTLYPIVFLNSYAQIAAVLLFVYAAVLGWAIYLLWRAVSAGDVRAGPYLPLVVCLAMLFFPLLHAYGQREFEVVVFFFIVAAAYLLVTRRAPAAGALLGYITWFKMWPVVFLGYFVVRRQWKALAMFLVASALTLAATQILFGLDRFVMFNPKLTPPQAAGQLRQFWPVFLISREMLQPTVFAYAPDHPNEAIGFCHGWYPGQQTMVSVRWAVCGLTFAHRWFPSRIVFYGLTVLFALTAAIGFLRAERRADWTDDDRHDRILLELSLVLFGAAFMLRAHYHYLVFLLLPICALARRYLSRHRWVSVGWLAAAYVILSAFVVPVSVMSRLLGRSFWEFYTGHIMYFSGELILVGLLLREYLAVSVSPAAES